MAAAEQAEQDRLAAEEAKKKADEEAAKKAAEKAKQDRLDALPKLKIQPGIGGWYKLVEGAKTKFYASSPQLQPGIIQLNIPLNDYLIRYENVEPNGDGVYKLDGTEYLIENPNEIEGTTLLVTKNYGDALALDGKVNPNALKDIDTIKNQAVEAIEALHSAGIVHQDVKLDNMVWDAKNKNLTLIDLGNANELDDACDAQFNGDKMNIFPPPEMADAKLADYWSLAIALLNLGGKLQPVEDAENGGGSSMITEALFSAGGRKDGNCYEVGDDRFQKGLLFIKKDSLSDATGKRKKEIKELVNKYGYEIFEYLWFTFYVDDNDLKKNIGGKTMVGIIPGYGQDPSIVNTGKNSDDFDYMNLLTARMAYKRDEMAKQWVQGHLRWEEIQTKLKDQKVYTVTAKKIVKKNAPEPQFEQSEFGDLGKEFYGIPTDKVVDIFKMLTSNFPNIAQSVNLSNPASLLDLDYDSFSDAELDEFEASLEPYDDEELEKLMDGALTGMAKDSYDSSSDSSRPSSVSYNSSSDTGLSETALSYDSSSDGGYSGAAHSYNSESEQSFHDSEHGASYDSDSDEDR